MFSWSVVQGEGSLLPLTVAGCPLDPTAALLGTVSTGLTDAALLAFSPRWAPAGPPYVECTLTPAQTATLPPGGYVVQVGLANGGGELAYGSLRVLAAPGNVPAFDVLATPGMMLMLAPEVRADADRVAALPLALRAASNMIRRLANRRFTRGDYVEYLTPSLEGEIRLKEIPVNVVTRVSRRPDVAVRISADPATFQTAYVDFSSQDGDFSLPSNLEFTGINLNSTTDGVATTTNLLFADMTTVGDLIDAANAVPGWTASEGAPGYARWPIGEVYCDAIPQGALADEGVRLRVFAEDVNTARVDRRTGMIDLGAGRYRDDFGPRWGPNWMSLDDHGLGSGLQVVRVAYNAGFTTVPESIQTATVQLAKSVLNQIETDYQLKKESIGEFSYELNDKLLAIPDPVRQAVAPYILYQA